MSNVSLQSPSVSIPIPVDPIPKTNPLLKKVKNVALSVLKWGTSLSLTSVGIGMMYIPNPICNVAGAAMSLCGAAMSMIFMGRWFASSRDKLAKSVNKLEDITNRQALQLQTHDALLTRQTAQIEKQEEILVKQEQAIERQEIAVSRQSEVLQKQTEVVERHEGSVARQEELLKVQHKSIEALRVEVYEVKMHGKTLQETTGSLNDVVNVFTSLANDMFNVVNRLERFMSGDTEPKPKSYLPARKIELVNPISRHSSRQSSINSMVYTKRAQKLDGDLDDIYDALPPPEFGESDSGGTYSNRLSLQSTVSSVAEDVIDMGFTPVSDPHRPMTDHGVEIQASSTNPFWADMEEISEERSARNSVEDEPLPPPPAHMLPQSIVAPSFLESRPRIASSMKENLQCHVRNNELTKAETEKIENERFMALVEEQVAYERKLYGKLSLWNKMMHGGFESHKDRVAQSLANRLYMSLEEYRSFMEFGRLSHTMTYYEQALGGKK